MVSSPFSHADDRLGSVAVDMGFLTTAQLELCRSELLRIRGERGVSSVSLGDVAVSLDFLDPDRLDALKAEEKRRRRLINGYEIIDLVGSGSIATVYRALQVAMNRVVALRILHPRLATDPEFVKTYIEESRAVSRFHHPNIVQGFDVGQSNGFYYFASEYMSGGSLSSLINTGERLQEGKALLYLRQTAMALRHAWAAAVFHGDLNPGNLMLDGQGDIKLANLGIPRAATPAAESKHGFVRCGPEYAAPEQLEHPELINAGTDIYNLGATFYHLSFGNPPFGEGRPEEILESRRRDPVPEFSNFPNFSQKYINLIQSMLMPEPDKRPTDPDDLVERLEGFQVADGDNYLSLSIHGNPKKSVRLSHLAQPRRPSLVLPRPADTGMPRHFSLSRRPKYFPSLSFRLFFLILLAFLSVMVLLFLV
ncbi:MAG: serine/threonine protein kinase [Planctomycetota bacterium]|jgi:serine/threonine-protein kinase|nr:serine/threonine protein kinase [Planctomycetota bacterium]